MTNGAEPTPGAAARRAPSEERLPELGERLMRRFTRISLALTLLATLVMGFAIGRLLDRSLDRQVALETARRLDRLAERLLDPNAPALGGAADLARVEAALRAGEWLERPYTRVALRDAAGRPVDESAPPAPPPPATAVEGALRGETWHDLAAVADERRLRLLAPIVSGGAVVGAFEVERSLEPFAARVAAAQRVAALSLAVFGLVLFLLLFGVVDRAARRLTHEVAANAQLSAAEQRQSTRVEVASVMARLQTADIDQESLVKTAVSEVRRLVDYHVARVVLGADGTGWSVVEFEAMGDGEPAFSRRSLPELPPSSRAHWVVARGMVAIDADVGRRPRFGDDCDWCARGIRAVVALPLRSKGRVLGALTLGHASAGAYSAAEVDVLRPVAESLASAIEHGRLFHQVEASEKRFRALVQNASDLTAIIDAGGLVRYASPPAERALGYEPRELVGRDGLELIHPDDFERCRAILVGLAATPGQKRVLECRVRHADGDWRWLEVILSNALDDPAVGGIVVNARDITERKLFEEQLTRQAFYDALTDLPNRALFMDRLEHALARAGRWRQPVAVMFLDLDRFKMINDSLGHSAGDELIVAVGRRLVSCLRAGDTIARFGGDEFTILLESVGQPEEAERVAERIAGALRPPFKLRGQEAFVTASIGIAVGTPGRGGAGDLVRDADLALYRAKVEGKARHVVFDQSMAAFPIERLSLDTGLRRAIERDELTLHYQPEIDLATGAIYGLEALVRWQHPRRGLISPGQFIPVAEENGLIVDIGRWALREACRSARGWRALNGDRPIVVSVNLAAAQFAQPELVEDVAAVLRETGLEPGSLRLEITESVLVEEAQATIRKLHALKRLGVRLAIDDFGTGYSSLSYLRHLSADTLKIDQSFVRGLGEDDRNCLIIRAVTSLAHALGMEVTAEGIETAEQLAQVRAAGCDRGQGFYFARPLQAPAIPALLGAGLASATRSPSEVA